MVKSGGGAVSVGSEGMDVRDHRVAGFHLWSCLLVCLGDDARLSEPGVVPPLV